MITAEAATTVRERFEQICQLRAAADPSTDLARLRSAWQLAEVVYGGRMHWSGEPVLDHCVGVLEEFLRFQPDEDGIVACLLHHALDDRRWTPAQVEHATSAPVRSIVSGVHLLSHVTMQNRRMSLQNLRLMFLRVSDDIRVVLLILSAGNYLLSRLSRMSPEQRKYVSRDALQIFAPVAARLGIYSLKHELESRAFPVVYSTDALRIAEQLQEIKLRHGTFLPEAAADLERALREHGMTAQVEAREKQPYSVFRKMRSKSLTHVGNLYDLFALRVIVDSEAACYQALGLLHRMGHPVANRFKDFIAFPKPNGYRSLHTTLARLPMVPEGVIVEVQIRTRDMHREAKLGIAAHWSYKEGGSASHAVRRERLQRALLEQQPVEGQERPLTDHIFALTPAGDIIELPEGATPLDFAFHVHTMLGLSFKGARVNGSIVPISHELENGDIVEILRYSEPKPSPHWLSLLKTASARTRLKHFLAEHERPAFLEAGRQTVNRELRERGLAELDPNLTLLRIVDGDRQTIAEREDLLVAVGKGSQQAPALLRRVEGVAALFAPEREERVVPQSVPAEALRVRMEDGIPMPVRYARCCRPDEGARGALAGVIGRDGSIRVHRGACKLLANVNPERRIGVVWDEGRMDN